jgi:hypothetical protein
MSQVMQMTAVGSAELPEPDARDPGRDLRTWAAAGNAEQRVAAAAGRLDTRHQRRHCDHHRPDPVSDPTATTYPEADRFQVGKCASGWIPFGVGHDTAVFAINYHNSIGGSVVWDPHT